MTITEKQVRAFVDHLVEKENTFVKDEGEGCFTIDGCVNVAAALEAANGVLECAARRQGTAGGNDPVDCGWPVCGCDPHADKVIEALQESGVINAAPPAPSVAVKALEVISQALLEYKHAIARGPSWYTNGESGMKLHLRAWDDRVKAALTAQVQDVAETEADIVERMVKSIRDPFPSANLSVSRGIDGWRELMRDALRAAAPAAKQDATP